MKVREMDVINKLLLSIEAVGMYNHWHTTIEKLRNSPGILGLPGNSQDGHFWVIRNWPWNSPGI